ncbi:hypothetical protein [Flavobacterium praedii]|uniref:hypothetical protein n=1 Tax=Flavobacterium praedii TaxID=3002900 RepID=UPI002481F38D|nr:hypothetical protein [Flavobacterium praedii]
MTTNAPMQSPFKGNNVLIILLTLFFTIMLLVGCKATPPTNTHTIERIIEHKTDSTKVTQVNKAILDSLVIKIAKVKTVKPECDSITQATLDQVLSQLNSYKKSGNNEYRIGYDAALKQIVILLKQAETKDESTTTNKVEKEKEKDKEIKPVLIKYIPWWVKYLAYLGGATLLYLAYRISRFFLV